MSNDPGVQTAPQLNPAKLFEQFIAERRYLTNVSAKTVEWYRCSIKAFEPHLAECTEEELRLAVRSAVMAMAEEGRLSPVSINNYARCMNAFLNWLLTEGFIIRPIRLKKLKTTKKVLVILTNEQVEKLIRYQPKKKIQRRVHVMVPLILDCGMRVDEVLHVNKEDVDLDNLLIKVRKGKGDKQRIVPITLPMRKHLYRYLKSESHPKSQFVFSTALGSAQAYRNANRILKSIGESIGLPELRFHLLRHTFATNFISMGGNVVILKKILGHASLATTMIYEHLQTADLQVAHHQHSLVGKLG